MPFHADPAVPAKVVGTVASLMVRELLLARLVPPDMDDRVVPAVLPLMNSWRMCCPVKHSSAGGGGEVHRQPFKWGLSN